MTFHIPDDCQIHAGVLIEVDEGSLGHRSILREGVIIQGKHVVIGDEAYLDIRARIGGGSCFDPQSLLMAGDFLHMGVDSHINTAREVHIGHECGIGVGTKIFTHGAYQSVLQGFPVQWDNVYIGNNVWLPNAWVNPGVWIGDNVVVAAMSLVNRNLPPGCLAGGIPVKILKENEYPKKLTLDQEQDILLQITNQACKIVGIRPRVAIAHGIIALIEEGNTTYFDTRNRVVTGAASVMAETLKNQLRRNGIRFRYHAILGERGKEYTPWSQ